MYPITKSGSRAGIDLPERKHIVSNSRLKNMIIKNHKILWLFLILAAAYLLVNFLPRNSQQSSVVQTQNPKRIISINPAATEIIFELGCDDKLVAVSNYCNWPPQTQQIEKAGDFLSPNFERMSMLKPDLIIIQGKAEAITNFCKHRNIECITIDLRNINELYEGINKLGKKLGCDENAKNLCSTISVQLAEIKGKVASAKKKKVFFSLYRTPGSLAGITTVGPKTLLNELLVLAGGKNIFDDLALDYTVISKESLLKRQPDIIIEPYTSSDDNKPNPDDILKDWSKLSRLNAVKNNELYSINADLVLKPGPRITQAAVKLAQLLHPELFSE